MKKAWCTITIESGEKVKIDREDLERVSEYKWRATKGTTGRLRVVTSIRGPHGPRSLTLGRFLMKPPKGKQVYPRRFNDGLDYRKDNLIVCSLKERQRMIPKRRSEATSKYRGVSFSKSDKRWRAGIEKDGKPINLGHYRTEEEAALAYNRAAREIFGDIAYQNLVKKSQKRKQE